MSAGELRTGKPVDFGETSVAPLEEQGIHHYKRNGLMWFYAFKRPVGILITTPQGTLALDISGCEIEMHDRFAARPPFARESTSEGLNAAGKD